MKLLNYLYRGILLTTSLGFVFGQIGCTRKVDDVKLSTIHIRAPSRIPLNTSKMLAAPPADGLVCYGVSVSGPDLPFSPQNACSPQFGKTVGFIPDGGTLSMTIPYGTDRHVEVYAYLAEPGITACPGWNTNYQSIDVTDYTQVYKIGEATGVATNQPNVTVTIAGNFPGIGNDLVASLALDPYSCISFGPSQLRSVLYRDGSILNPTDATFALDNSSPTNAGHFEDIMTLNRSGEVAYLGTTILVPQHVRSLAVKPDTLDLVGLVAGGKVVSVDALGNVSDACPFATCQVPPWFQSISAGYGQELFGLDYSGQVYRVNADGTVTMVATVSNAALQVTYY